MFEFPNFFFRINSDANPNRLKEAEAEARRKIDEVQKAAGETLREKTVELENKRKVGLFQKAYS